MLRLLYPAQHIQRVRQLDCDQFWFFSKRRDSFIFGLHIRQRHGEVFNPSELFVFRRRLAQRLDPHFIASSVRQFVRRSHFNPIKPGHLRQYRYRLWTGSPIRAVDRLDLFSVRPEQRDGHINTALVNNHAEELSFRHLNRISMNLAAGEFAFDGIPLFELANVRRRVLRRTE